MISQEHEPSPNGLSFLVSGNPLVGPMERRRITLWHFVFPLFTSEYEVNTDRIEIANELGRV